MYKKAFHFLVFVQASSEKLTVIGKRIHYFAITDIRKRSFEEQWLTIMRLSHSEDKQHLTEVEISIKCG